MNLEDFRSLTDVELRRSFESEHGLFIAEGAKVINRAFRAGFVPRSIISTERWIETLDVELRAIANIEILNESEMELVTGFHVHRGALASFERPQPIDAESLLRDSRKLVVLDGLVDHENVGAIFRSVAGLGWDGVLITEDCADPLYRRAIKTSMAATLAIPFARVANSCAAMDSLQTHGFWTVATTPAGDCALGDSDPKVERIAAVFGSEGSGLGDKALAKADVRVSIPMHHGIDSLNVAQAAAIVLWHLGLRV